ncbi:26S proteasome subunit RPN7-domain-containing protein [Catenaria anguillulae PL171]|uniref:26S proteasome subunit RPN7-domain-containing protein n=1 Tax=Catenaria anguillulae PL171 TaxID=765915 RepID=A0A1Y2HY99_9FUNG|nr:26S proteasome subunit RPN7-domain-containing protein [Catenaria anguillulae PL171]
MADPSYPGSRSHSPTPAKRARNHPVVVDAPTFDLDTYISGYRGRTKIKRLAFIGSRCPTLAIDAHRAALALNQALEARNQPCVAPDQVWLEQAQRTARVDGDRLDAELKTYKHNSIKDSIRMGYNDLAEHHFKCGDFSNAVKCFLKAREYATTPKNQIHHTVNLIHCYLLLNQYQQVQLNLNRLNITPPPGAPAGPASSTSATAAAADDKDASKKPAPIAALEIVFQSLVNLKDSAYERVARDLLKLQLATTADHVEEVVSTNDIALLVGLCALATFPRPDIKRLVLDSNTFRGFLDLEPHMRQTLSAFYHAKYATCLQLLAEHMNDRLLDVYLAPHMEHLLAKIRHRAVIQYCAPFTTVDLARMARAFAWDDAVLVSEVEKLIVDGALKMRIDARARILKKRTRNERVAAFKNVLQTGDKLELARHQAMLKMAMVAAGVTVHSTQKGGGGPGGKHDMDVEEHHGGGHGSHGKGGRRQGGGGGGGSGSGRRQGGGGADFEQQQLQWAMMQSMMEAQQRESQQYSGGDY